jgi:hypothetical protein
MATNKNEYSSDELGAIAAKVLRTGKATPKEAVALAACVLTQRPDRPNNEPAIRRDMRTR